MNKKQPDSWNDFAKLYPEMREGYTEPSPEAWWNQWLSETDRGFFGSRLQESDRRLAFEYGLSKTWKLIPVRVQELIKQI